MVGLFFQQAIALFVLKSGAGFHMFRWIATLASDFLNQGLVGSAFFFDQDTVNTKHWLFVNLVRHSTRREREEITNAYRPAVIAPYRYFLHRIRANVLLSWHYAVDNQALRLVLLQDNERIWC
jgi:hypothetical protein